MGRRNAAILELSGFFDGKACFHPSPLALRIVCHVRITHRRQFTGGVRAGMSMRIRAVGDNLGALVG